MRRYALDFLRRGLTAAGFGPIILAILYLILRSASDLEVLSVGQVCVGIFSLTALSFIAGGMNFIYQLERLPLMVAILIHGGVLYVGYLVTYLVNEWLERSVIPMLVFSVIFVVGYFAIWAVIYSITRKNTEKLNEILTENKKDEAE